MAGRLRVYYDMMSQPSRALVIFLRAAGIPYEDCPVALRNGEHMSEEYAKINPARKVPAIVDGDFRLSESIAIFRYLCATRPGIPEHFYPTDAKQRARVDEYLEWQHLGLRLQDSMFFQHRVIIPRLKGRPVNESELGKWRSRFEQSLDEIESIFIKDDRTFVNGMQDVSLADILCCAEIEQALSAGYNDLESSHPKIAAYMERVRKRLAPHYEEGHGIIRKVRDAVRASKI